MAAISSSASNIKSPPTIAKGDKGEPPKAGQSISYNSAKSNTAGLATAAPEAEPAETRKGRGVAIGRAGGAF